MVVSAMKCSLFGGFSSGKVDKTSTEGVQLLCLADFYQAFKLSLFSVQSSVHTGINCFSLPYLKAL